MSVDVNGHINPVFGVQEIVDFLKAKGYYNPQWQASNGTPDYFQINFIDNSLGGGREPRMMHVHVGQGVFGSNKISLNKHGNAEKIIRAIVDQFSGIYIPNDCENHAEIVDGGWEEGRTPFVLKWALAQGYIEDSSLDSMVKAISKFKEKHGWG